MKLHLKTLVVSLALGCVLALPSVALAADEPAPDESTAFDLAIAAQTGPRGEVVGPGGSGEGTGTEGGVEATPGAPAPLPKALGATGDSALSFMIPFILAALCASSALLLLVPRATLQPARIKQRH